MHRTLVPALGCGVGSSIDSVNAQRGIFDSWNLIAGNRITEWNRLLCLLMAASTPNKLAAPSMDLGFIRFMALAFAVTNLPNLTVVDKQS